MAGRRQGPSTTLRLSEFNDQSYGEVDNVIVQSAAPAPSSLIPVVTGLFAAAGAATAKPRWKAGA